MRDVLETPRMGLVVVAAVATLAGLAAGWGMSLLVRGEEVRYVPNDLPELESHEAFDPPPEVDMDFGLMLEALIAAGMRIVPESWLQRLDVPAVGPDGRLTGPLTDVLLLSDEEIDRLNRALAEAEIRLREIELDRVQVVERSAERLVLRFEAYREEGAAVERMLRERIAGAIGQVDAELLWNLMTRDEAEPGFSYWGNFGREPAMVVFERRIIDESDGDQTVEIRFARRTRDTEEGNAGVEPNEEWTALVRMRVGEGSDPPDDAWAMLTGRYAYLDTFLPPQWEVYFSPVP